MNLASTDFELFDLPPRFAVDSSALDARWRELQGRAHPDKFVVEGAAAQRVAMQWAVRINEAYRRLKDPVLRAVSLCEANGVAVDGERNTAMPAAFLGQQMAWREALEEASSATAVTALADEVAAHRAAALVRLQAALDVDHDYRAAASEVRALMFSARFAEAIDQRLEALGQ